MIKININNLQAFLPSDFWKKVLVENLEKNLNGLLKSNGRLHSFNVGVTLGKGVEFYKFTSAQQHILQLLGVEEPLLCFYTKDRSRLYYVKIAHLIAKEDLSKGNQGYVQIPGVYTEIYSEMDTGEGKDLKWFLGMYAGVTKRGYIKRTSEHCKAAMKDSQTSIKFHWHLGGALEDGEGLGTVLMEVNKSFDDIMNWEEAQVNYLEQKGFCLNMIPGGFAGLRFISKYRNNFKPSYDADDKYLEESKLLIDHPWIVEASLRMKSLWVSDKAQSMYLNMLVAMPNTLEPDDVRFIRYLDALGKSVTEIKIHVEANNRQIRDILSGKHYSRVQ